MRSLAAEPPAHPVVAGAAPGAGRRCRSMRTRLEGAIDARERELEDPPPADLAALEQQLGATSGAHHPGGAGGCSAPPATAARAAGDRVGLVVGLAELLRALPADLARGRSLLPAAELARHGLDAAARRPSSTPRSRSASTR